MRAPSPAAKLEPCSCAYHSLAAEPPNDHYITPTPHAQPPAVGRFRCRHLAGGLFAPRHGEVEAGWRGGGEARGETRGGGQPVRPTARWLRATTIKVYPADSFALSFAANSLILEQTHGKYG